VVLNVQPTPAGNAARQWYEFAVGERGFIQVLASSPTEARDRAQAELENLGVLPGRADRHESWQRFARETS
jgi:hypothetical protein